MKFVHIFKRTLNSCPDFITSRRKCEPNIWFWETWYYFIYILVNQNRDKIIEGKPVQPNFYLIFYSINFLD